MSKGKSVILMKFIERKGLQLISVSFLKVNMDYVTENHFQNLMGQR